MISSVHFSKIIASPFAQNPNPFYLFFLFKVVPSLFDLALRFHIGPSFSGWRPRPAIIPPSVTGCCCSSFHSFLQNFAHRVKGAKCLIFPRHQSPFNAFALLPFSPLPPFSSSNWPPQKFQLRSRLVEIGATGNDLIRTRKTGECKGRKLQGIGGN